MNGCRMTVVNAAPTGSLTPEKDDGKNAFLQ
jgi:hypothetical protein